MIPLYKFEKLPRTQKLRKIVKIFGMAEKRLNMAAHPTFVVNGNTPDNGAANVGVFSVAEIVFFADAAKMLAEDTFFSKDAKKAFAEAADVFHETVKALNNISFKDNDILIFKRSLNCIKHILLMETGHDLADWDLTDIDGRLDPERRQIFEGMHVYLEDIRSPFNVGAMFRTAESFGVEKMILSPFCADPHHRRAERTAMGCIDIIPWERRELFAAPEAEAALQNEPLAVFALETQGIPLAEFSFPKRGLLIAGSEELGVSPQALAVADASLGRVSIPCYGTKASLNVSVAFGIAIHSWANVVNQQ
ncbi:MAG: TrmH family RNA methyltransferase [Treponema sp.]|nr:TrmH family RNA methyltransferase [Treponema sp.]